MARILVTNDDGIDAEGLRQLARAADGAGHDVVVAAPEENVSGASASLTAVRDGGQVVVQPRRLAGLEHLPAHGVGATPAYLTLLAVRGAFGPPPEVVLSGINEGENAGQAILHSGTVGAAFTAAAHGRRALAVSLRPGEPRRWDTAVGLVHRLLPAVLAAPSRTVVNLNVPNVAPGALRGIRRAPLSRFGAVQTNVAESGQGYVTVEVTDLDEPLEPGTDAALLREGFATVSLLRPLCELHDPALAALVDERAGAPGGRRNGGWAATAATTD